MSIHYLDFEDYLRIAEQIPGDPQFDDYGPIMAAQGRAAATRIGQDIYGSLRLKAAAIVHTLLMLDCLEHSQHHFAWSAGVEFLRINGQKVPFEPRSVAEAVQSALSREPAAMRKIATALRA